MMRKFGMGMVIVMLMMKPIMMMPRMKIRKTINMIEQPVEEEVQVGSVCPPAGGGPVQGVHQAGVGQELQQLHLPLLGDTLQFMFSRVYHSIHKISQTHVIKSADV